MKILGAWMIAWGILSLMIGFVGLQLRLLFWMDEFGPIMAYVLKIGLIIGGVLVWRTDDRAAVEEDVTEEESKRAWIPVAISGTLIVGVIAFIVVSEFRNNRLENKINKSAKPAVWAATAPSQWPDLVLLQKAKFAHHTPMAAGCASLVRLPTGEIVALTAGHLLGKAGGVSPGFTQGGLGGMDQTKLATLTSEITSWKLYVPNDEEEAIKATGLYGRAIQFDEHCDEILLSLSPGEAGYPTTPLDVRIKPVTFDESLRVVTFGLGPDGNLRQVTYKAKRVPGPVFTCTLEHPEDLNGASGAPVVDKDGLLVGIVTGGTMMDLNNPTDYVRAFSGHTISELMPVMKAAVSQKGIAPPSQAKVMVHPVKVKSTEDKPEKVLGDSI